MNVLKKDVVSIRFFLFFLFFIVITPLTFALIEVEKGVVFEVDTGIYNASTNFTATGINLNPSNITISNITLFKTNTPTINDIQAFELHAYDLHTGATLSNIDIHLTGSQVISNTIFNSIYSAVTEGSYSATLSKSGYLDKTISFTSTSESAILLNESLVPEGELLIHIYNATTNTQINQNTTIEYYNSSFSNIVTIENGTGSLTNLMLNSEYTLNFISENFQNSTYTVTYNEDNSILNVYLIETGSKITFTVQDTSLNFLDSAKITISTFVNGTNQIIGSKLTDASGTTFFYLEENKPHTITATKTGYKTFTSSINVDQTAYNIKMSLVSSINFNSPTGGVTYSVSPENFKINSSSVTFLFNVSSVEDLDYFRIDLYNGTTLIDSVVDDFSKNGASISLPINLTPYNDTFLISKYTYKKTDYQNYTFTKTHYININSKNTIDNNFLTIRSWSEENLSNRDKIFIFGLINLVFTISMLISGRFEGTSILVLNILIGLTSAYILGFGIIMTFVISLIYFSLGILFFSQDQQGGLI